MRTRFSPIALVAMLMLTLMVFSACDLNGEPDAVDAPSVPGEPLPPEQAAPSEEAATEVPATPREPLSVVASIFPLGYFAERVGGDLVTVEVLVRPGFENHGFVPTASDLRSLEDADLVVMNGLELEPWMERALATLGENPDRIVVEAADAARAIEGVPHGHGHGDEGHEEDDDHAHEDDDDHGHEEDEHAHDHGELDPHMWLDPVLAVAQVERIRDAFISVDPGNADTYRANASALADELGTLDAEIAEGLSSCRHDHFVTSHAAYGYLAARYGIEQIPVAGLSPETEPSPRELAEISDQIAELGLEYVMVEPVLSGELTSALAREHGIDLISIHAIESVTQAELDDHDDYFGLMRDNLANLVLALDCA
ncbi:MAG: ABC transporter substrate-binding protein [Chloroflexi bacterium]|nr:ABC transporter substrate-binding protein [Chloroflexota bacterium]